MATTDPKPVSFTFQGSTIQFTQTQKDTLQKDQDNIDHWQSVINDAISAYNYSSSQYNNYLNKDCGPNTLGHKVEYANCMKERETGMNYHGPLRDAAKAKWDSSIISMAAAVKNYNDDLEAIKNSIKLQIQASQAQSSSDQAAANANATQNMSLPSVQIKAQEAAAQVAIKKEEEKRKIITYAIFGVVILVIVIVVVKKLF